MLIDHRMYRVKPNRMPEQLELYKKFGYPVQLRYMGEPHYYMTTETGQLSTIVHGWVYESATDREAKRARMMQDPDWKVYVDEAARAGLITELTNWLATPVPFAPPIPPAKIVK